jgi:hypothetical protein
MTDTNTQISSIHASMAQCVTDIGLIGVTKDAVNSFQKFNYRSIDGMLTSFNKVLAKNQIYTTQRTLDPVFNSIGNDSKGAHIYLLQMTLEVRFISGIDGSSVVSSLFGTNDGKDCAKLTGQLTSYLLKELMFKCFFCPTEGADDLDARDPSGIPLKVVDRLENSKGIALPSCPNNLEGALFWAAKHLGITKQEAETLMDSAKPDADGKKFTAFVDLVRSNYLLS